MSSMLIDNRRDRGTFLAHFVFCALVAAAGILAYLYVNTLGVYYARERDNIGNTYCLYWMPFANFENSMADQANSLPCAVFAKPSKPVENG